MSYDRREFVKQLGVYFAATCSFFALAKPALAKPALGLWPGERTRKRRGSDRRYTDASARGNYGAIGCALDARGASAARRLGRISRSSGNRLIDRLYFVEADLMNRVARVRPDLAFIEDRTPNAFAAPVSLFGSPYGTVLMGINLIRSESREGIMEPAPIMIMMHEWTHIKEFHTGARGRIKSMELLSDAMAGWYLQGKAIWRATQNLPSFNWYRAMRSIYDKGDYEFNNPHHHGTPRERLAALKMGATLAGRGVQNYDWAFALLRRQFRL